MTPPKTPAPLKTPERLWTALYNVESNLRGNARQAPRTKRGRPPSSNPRENTSVYLTEQEQTVLKQLVTKLEETMPSGTVSRGQVVGFALRLMAELIERCGLPNRDNSPDWTAVVDHLLKGL